MYTLVIEYHNGHVSTTEFNDEQRYEDAIEVYTASDLCILSKPHGKDSWFIRLYTD